MLQDPWAAAGPWHTRTTGTAGVEGAGGTGGLAAAAVGDGKAWLRRPWAAARPGRASRSTTPSHQARVWRSRGRAAAHGLTKQPGPTAGSDGARNTSGTTNTNTTKRAGTLRFRPALDAQWLSALRDS